MDSWIEAQTEPIRGLGEPMVAARNRGEHRGHLLHQDFGGPVQ